MIIWVLNLFCVVLLYILATSSEYLLLLLGPYHFCPFQAHLCMKCSLGISNFLEEISSLSHCFIFLYFFALISEEGFLISSCYLEFCFQMSVSFISLLLFASRLFTAICKASSDNSCAFLHFFFLGMVLIPASCTMSRTSIHSSSGTVYQI